MAEAAALILAAIALIVALAALLYRRFPMRAIYRSKTHLEHAFDSFDDPLAVISESYVILRANRAYASLVNRPYAELVGAHCYDVLRGRSSPCEDCRMTHTLAKRSRNTVARSPHPVRGTGSTISLTFFPYDSADGSQAVLEHIRDTTVLEKLRARLERKNTLLVRTARDLQQAQNAIRNEIDMAREVQECILPKRLPTVRGVKIDVTYEPIETVGGDIYDFIPFGDDHLGVFIGDASGHGLPAAFVSTMAKMSLYHHTRRELPPAELMQLINQDIIANIQTNHYLTCFWMLVDLTTRELWFSRAGHPKPVLIRSDGEIVELDAPGTLLGILDSVDFSEARFQYRSGDRLFLFTDGVYMSTLDDEIQRPAFSTGPFQKLLESCATMPFEDIVAHVRRELGEYEREDDYTLIVMEFE